MMARSSLWNVGFCFPPAVFPGNDWTYFFENNRVDKCHDMVFILSTLRLVRNTLISLSRKAKPLNIPGARDVARAKYCAWQQAQVENEEDKQHYQKALDFAREVGLDLEQIYEDQDPDFFTKQGVKWGISRRFTSARDIEVWAKRHQQEFLPIEAKF